MLKIQEQTFFHVASIEARLNCSPGASTKLSQQDVHLLGTGGEHETCSGVAEAASSMIKSSGTQLYYSTSRRRVVSAYRLRVWWVRKVIEYQTIYACNGWTRMFRTYNIVDRYGPGVECAEIGTVSEMRQLFDQRKASLFDIRENGETLLHVRTRLCSFSNGSDIGRSLQGGVTPKCACSYFEKALTGITDATKGKLLQLSL